MPITERTAGDLTWAATYKSLPLPPMTILGMPILQHPQPQLAQASSGTMSPSPSVPTSLLHIMARLSTEPLPQSQPTHSIEEHPASGTNQPRSMSTHSSLYWQSRNLSPALQPSQLPRATTGQMSLSNIHCSDLDVTEDVGNKSTDNSDQTHNLHQSYSCPLSRDTMSTSPTRPVERAPSTSFPDPSCHSQTRLPSPMESQNLS